MIDLNKLNEQLEAMREPTYEKFTANDLIRWALYTVVFLLALESTFGRTQPPETVNFRILLGAIFLTGALVLRGLRTKPNQKEKTHDQ